MRVHVYVEEGPKGHTTLRPAFGGDPVEEWKNRPAALERMRRALRKHVRKLAKDWTHEPLARMAFDPDPSTEVVRVRCDLGKSSEELRLLVVHFKALGGRVAVLPAFGSLAFQYARGEDLGLRVQEVVQHHLRGQAKHRGGEAWVPPSARVESKWTLTLEPFTVDLPGLEPAAPKKAFSFAALLGATEVGTGAEELESVGRCLDRRDEARLDHAVRRDAEVAELLRVLGLGAAGAARPIALVGPPRVGKTALVHELVRRRRAADRARQGAARSQSRSEVWLISPARLISGMSLVGQWEARLLAILEEARRRRHVLWVDDPVGLYEAGISSGSTLSVGQVLRPWVERGEVQLLVECSEEELAVVRERDRALADALHVIRVRPTGPSETVRVLVAAGRELERRHRVEFAPEVIPAVYDLGGQVGGLAANPGAPAELLAEVAARHAGTKRPISRQQVLDHVRARTGLQLALLDPAVRETRDDLRARLGNELVGHEQALDLAADVLSVARARLEDPRRPLGVFLLAGPTGVGKTAFAKALCRVLYEDEHHLIRFDMNQQADPGAAARLVGRPGAPEGLLTAAIRQRPHAVLLLDEIEKADPGVLDLLLQVLEDGMLTDARGRRADFTRAVIVMTSNLGTRSGAPPGLVAPPPGAATGFRKAIEQFFRPELLNRIDHVVAFGALGPDERRAVAARLLRDVLGREGLARRRALLQVHPEALEGAVVAAADPALGARSLRRVLEREIAEPVAMRLAQVEPDQPLLIEVVPGPEGPRARSQVLVEAAGVPLPGERLSGADPQALAGALRAAYQRIVAAVDEAVPEGEVDGRVMARAAPALELREVLHVLRSRLEAVERALGAGPRRGRKPAPRGGPAHWALRAGWLKGRTVLREALSALDVKACLDEMMAAAPSPLADVQVRVGSLARELAFLDMRARDLVPAARLVEGGGAPAEVRLNLQPWGDAAELVAEAARALRDVYLSLGYWVGEAEVLVNGSHQLALRGRGAAGLAALERGYHMYLDPAGAMRLVALRPAGDDEVSLEVVRLYPSGGPALDLRTRIAAPEGRFEPGLHREVLLAQLPLPAELEEVCP